MCAIFVTFFLEIKNYFVNFFFALLRAQTAFGVRLGDFIPPHTKNVNKLNIFHVISCDSLQTLEIQNGHIYFYVYEQHTEQCTPLLLSTKSLRYQLHFHKFYFSLNDCLVYNLKFPSKLLFMHYKGYPSKVHFKRTVARSHRNL